MSNRRYDLQRGTTGAPARADAAQSNLQFIYEPFSGPETEKAFPARLLYVTAAKYEGDWHSILHTHAFSELFYITGGKGQFAAGDRRFEIGADDLVVINPQVEHTELSLDANPLEYVVVGIDGLCFESDDPEQSDCSIMNYTAGRTEMRFYLNTLLREVQGDRPGREAMCQNLLNVLLISMLRHRGVSLSITPSRAASKECAAVRRYIDAHFKEPLTLDELAAQAHLNKYYMAHDFKNTYGMAPINYMIECRVEESRMLLRDTDYSLSQIAEIVGFSSASYFSQSFKRVAKLTPNEYRRQAREDEKSKPTHP